MTLRVEVTAYHGRADHRTVTTFLGADAARDWLEKHYRKSDANCASIAGRACFTLDQADRVLFALKQDYGKHSAKNL